MQESKCVFFECVFYILNIHLLFRSDFGMISFLVVFKCVMHAVLNV